ncbi:RAD55 family ATPase [Natronorubrum sp. FCH18a]|uniref:RAD55 family ATPase n=1 Tax=Natronorubrum sp. FCH18a TaxID=3447018 RepID=UPI003F511077
MSSQLRSDRAGDRPLECDHCRYPIPSDPKETDDGYVCSAACLEAVESEETVPDPNAYKRVVTGVEPLDSLVPNGVPADSFVCCAGEAGTRRDECLTELAWRALERGEPVVVVTVTTPPTAVLERFFESGWNVLPALENDRLRIVDCFTHQLADRDAFLERRSSWLEFVGEAAAESIVAVEDPTDIEAITTTLTETLDDLEMTETGLVTIDSLDELERRHERQQVHDFVAETRATVCKARYVPIVAGRDAHDERASVNDSLFDGIVDLRLTDHREPDARFRQLGVRKLVGAQHLPQWVSYEYEPVRGLLAFGPPPGGRTGSGDAPSSRGGFDRR